VGRRLAQSFDINTLFMEGQVDTSTRMEIVRSPFFNVIVGAYNVSNNVLRVGGFSRSGHAIGSVTLVTPMGLPVAKIVVGVISGTHTFEVFHAPTSPNSYSLMTTGNFRYMRNKVIDQKGDVYARLMEKITNNNVFFSHTIRNMIDRLIDKSMGSSIARAPNFSSPLSMDTELLTFMARHMAGETTLLEMPSHLRTLFDGMYKEYTDNRTKFKQAISTATEFVQGNKWVLVTNVNDGCILGGISPQPMIAAVEMYLSGGKLPDIDSFNYCDANVPFKWYKSLQDIPADIYRELEYSLVMLKTHRNSSDLIPKSTREFWTEMGCYSTDGAIHVLHR